MSAAESGAAIRDALANDLTIDIVTTGARSGLARRIEIWFTTISGQIVIGGTASAGATDGGHTPRDWLANLRAEPRFWFCLKESVQAELTAEAHEVRDLARRRAYFMAPETRWYRDNSPSTEVLIAEGPLVEVRFTGDYAWLND
ncbi:MAG: nitroreductase family deazaflavin-dependent oxidoreductase [Actinomycetia bacterium]|nr:nitroreductase family deazaflavin-dependent oxidoreductase [Actinomycetes bacterium]MCP3912468.1 nitroreductase family deazaflavin-dependent oxidoreductase [Actinomycetes bacterium]MCP4086003.1 nitroreductase family deazaflavin-dependent oxidoreductase [Actinomycetes bacterium]